MSVPTSWRWIRDLNSILGQYLCTGPPRGEGMGSSLRTHHLAQCHVQSQQIMLPMSAVDTQPQSSGRVCSEEQGAFGYPRQGLGDDDQQLSLNLLLVRRAEMGSADSSGALGSEKVLRNVLCILG